MNNYLLNNFENSCPICEKEYNTNTRILTHYCCYAKICEPCYIRWIQEKFSEYSCPFCRSIKYKDIFNGIMIKNGKIECIKCKTKFETEIELQDHNLYCNKKLIYCNNKVYGCNWSINSITDVKKAQHQLNCQFNEILIINQKFEEFTNKINKIINNFSKKLNQINKLIKFKDNQINQVKNRFGTIEYKKYQDFNILFKYINNKKNNFDYLDLNIGIKQKILININNRLLNTFIKTRKAKYKNIDIIKFTILNIRSNAFKQLNINNLIGIIILNKYYIGKSIDNNIQIICKSNINDGRKKIHLFNIKLLENVNKIKIGYHLFFC